MPEIDMSDEVYSALQRLPDKGRAITECLNEAWAEGCRLHNREAALAVLAGAWDRCQLDILNARAIDPLTVKHFVSVKDCYKSRFVAGDCPGWVV